MLLPEFIELASAGQVSAVDLHSLEGGIYLLEIHSAGQRCWLETQPGRPQHLRSVEHARELLAKLPPLACHLVQASAYDEMCGLSEGQREPLRVPVGQYSRW